jgi:hypothetical protein
MWRKRKDGVKKEKLGGTMEEEEYREQMEGMGTGEQGVEEDRVEGE